MAATRRGRRRNRAEQRRGALRPRPGGRRGRRHRRLLVPARGRPEPAPCHAQHRQHVFGRAWRAVRRGPRRILVRESGQDGRSGCHQAHGELAALERVRRRGGSRDCGGGSASPANAGRRTDDGCRRRSGRRGSPRSVRTCAGARARARARRRTSSCARCCADGEPRDRAERFGPAAAIWRHGIAGCRPPPPHRLRPSKPPSHRPLRAILATG